MIYSALKFHRSEKSLSFMDNTASQGRFCLPLDLGEVGE